MLSFQLSCRNSQLLNLCKYPRNIVSYMTTTTTNIMVLE
uniref:Uncharacterized protein n=1 Tax=Arundo donax TaxID=35708 RepID=A0A0A9AQR6_ARUDO